MIQRIQTLWLLAASVLGFATLNNNVSFYIGSINNAPAEHFTAWSNVFILVLTIIAATLSLVNIFLFKNRQLQLRLTIADLLLNILLIVLYFIETEKYTTGGLSLFCVIVFAIPVLLILAARGIYKDQKLVKSVDRLR
jgi:phosphatidylserine synthase